MMTPGPPLGPPPGRPPGPPTSGPGIVRPPRRGKALAVTSLVVGLISIPALAVCGLGLPLAVIAIVLGIIALVRGAGGIRVMAAFGILLSVVTLVLTGWLLSKAAKCGNPSRYPNEQSRRMCIEREFPFARPGR